jgi:hypothetical protein
LKHCLCFLTLLVISLAPASIFVASHAQGVAESGDQRVTQKASRQMQEISHDKSYRTRAQRKIDSQLLYALEQKRGKARGVPSETIKLDIDAKGRALLDISAKVSTRLTSRIRQLGGTVISKFEAYHTVRARLALEKLEALASMDDVRFIMRAAEATTN